jgi:phosphoribosylformylglycinamidine (FGAM) synthase-like enzyme
VALAECAIQGGLGFHGTFTLDGRWDAALFGEGPSRIIVSLAADQLPQVREVCEQEGVPFLVLGTVGLGADGGQRFAVSGILDVPLDAIAGSWRHGLDE